MATLETYRERFAESGWEVFARAVEETRRRGQNMVGVEHLLQALLQTKAEYFTSMLRSLSDNPEAVEMLATLIEERVSAAPGHEGGGVVRVAPELIDLLRRTLRRVRLGLRQRIEATDLFVSFVTYEKSLLRVLLSKLLADPEARSKHRLDIFALAESVGAAAVSSGGAKFQYTPGERVRIKTGPFASFTGIVETVDEEVGVLSVRVHIMGRSGAIGMRFVDVEKIKFVE